MKDTYFKNEYHLHVFGLSLITQVCNFNNSKSVCMYVSVCEISYISKAFNLEIAMFINFEKKLKPVEKDILITIENMHVYCYFNFLVFLFLFFSFFWRENKSILKVLRAPEMSILIVSKFIRIGRSVCVFNTLSCFLMLVHLLFNKRSFHNQF